MRYADLAEINDLMPALEERVEPAGAAARRARLEPACTCGSARTTGCRTCAPVAGGRQLRPAARNLGTVSLIGPIRMDYATAIRSVRGAAALLSEFVEQVYE